MQSKVRGDDSNSSKYSRKRTAQRKQVSYIVQRNKKNQVSSLRFFLTVLTITGFAMMSECHCNDVAMIVVAD